MSLDDVFNAALELSETEQIKLLARLMKTLPIQNKNLSIDDPDFMQELDRRFNDRDGSIPWSELRNEG